MILQALDDFYRRKMRSTDPSERLPAFGLEDKEIPFILELAEDGKLLGIKDTRRIEGKKKVGERYLVPVGVKKTSGVAANLLWDTAEYVLGVQVKANAQRVNQQTTAFRLRVSALPAAQSDRGLKAVLAFLNDAPLAQAERHELFGEIKELNSLLSFRLAGDTELVCQRPAVVAGLSDKTKDEKTSRRICVVTGEVSEPARLHSAIKGVWGAQSSGANIVSFNLEAFASFGKQQGENAPVCRSAAFAYTTALNHLLRRGSRQRLQIGDASTVFWAQEADDIEDVFAEIFSESNNPDHTESLRAVLESIHSGKFDGARGEKKFFVLGLAPNAARISVRFWQAEPLRDIARHIREWFEDIAIARAPHDPEFPSLFRLLTACAVQNKSDNVPPNLGGDIMRAILAGSCFPMSWLYAAVQRNRAEQKVTYLRAAAIKACLNRLNGSNTQEFQRVLDLKNTNVAYRIGRLFSALEKIQEEANPGLNATIRDRYYGAASSTPVAVFTTLLRLKNHHLSKIENKGRAITFERLLGEIIAGIDDFPVHLSLVDQGRFALGYYHQRQAFFTKSDKPESGE